jgi:FKBP-type peptidyl-prolyl cis-trans isomerase
MIRILIPGALALSLTTFTLAQSPEPPAAPAPAEAKIDPASVKPDSSYALGFRAGDSFTQDYSRFGITLTDIEMESFIKGFSAALKGEKPEFTEERLQAAMKALGEQLEVREKELAAHNLEEGKKFLEANGKREGVVTTKSGLQYEILSKGGETKYEAPKDGKTANKEFHVRYRGTLIDGTEFDKSPEGETVAMTLQVIDGFKEALTSMPVGAKWKLFIPGSLAYGEQRRSAEIAPNQLLIFELELVEIKDAASGLPPGLEGLGLPSGHGPGDGHDH